MASVGFSVENPASLVYASAGATANGGSVNGQIVNWANAGNSFLGSGGFANNFNTETAPDIIGKAAFDPGWGHYEIFGMARFFTDSIFTCNPALVPASGVCPTTTANIGSADSHVTVGEGVGGSVLLPAIPKLLELQGSVLYGKGIGRYGASQLSDVVVAPDGTLSPITAIHAMVGAVAHPWTGLDIYGYAGLERADANVSGSAAGPTGFGVATLSNAGCGIVTGASFTGGTSNCAAVNKEVDMVAVGFWQNLYKGDYGRLAAGAQYEYIKRKSFDGVPGPRLHERQRRSVLPALLSLLTPRPDGTRMTGNARLLPGVSFCRLLIQTTGFERRAWPGERPTRSGTRLLDTYLARLPHRRDPEALVDGGGAGQDLRLGLPEGGRDDIRLFAGQRHPARHMRGLRHRRPDRALVRVQLDLDQFERLELAVEADRQSDDFQLPAVLRGFHKCCHVHSPSCAASQLYPPWSQSWASVWSGFQSGNCRCIAS